MANTLLPFEERSLSPNEVEGLDHRRRKGQLFLTIGVQCLIVGLLVTLWAGQDATLSPGWLKPMVFWDSIAFGTAFSMILIGMRLRRGSNEFISY